MRFIESIQFAENPPAEYKVNGAVWAQNFRLYHKDHNGDSHILAYLEDFNDRSYHYIAPVDQLTHVIAHPLNSRNLVFSIQEDDSGNPGEYVQAVVFPTPGLEESSITVQIDVAKKIHVTLIKP